MALQGLRGSGFNPVSGAPFMQMRENRENKALAIMEKSKEREEKKKEREKEEKAADQVLKKEFDQAKQEAVILGLPVGRATSMSLGSLKGWLSAARELKVNNEKMSRLLLDQAKEDREAKKFKSEQATKVSQDKGAQIAMKNPIGGNKKVPQMSLQELTGFNNARNQQRMAAPPTMNQTTMPNGQTATQTFGGGQPLKTQYPPQMPTPFKPNGDGKTAGYVSGTGSYHPIAGANSRPMSHNPANDLIEPSTGKVLRKGQSSGGIEQTEYDQIKSSFNRISKELEAGPPDDLTTSQKEQWLSSRRTLVNEFGDLMLRAKVNDGNPTANTATPQAQQQDPKEMFDQYFTNGQPNQNYIETITSGASSAKEAKKNKIDLIRSLLSSGAINEETAKELLKNAPYPAN